MTHDVEVPEAIIEEAHRLASLAEPLLLPVNRAVIEAALNYAAPALRAAIEAEAECESCEDSGIYTEGAEWAPCGECNRGEEFARHLKIARAEVEAEVRERFFSALEASGWSSGEEIPMDEVESTFASVLAALATDTQEEGK